MTDERITALEIKLAYREDTLNQLDSLVFEQQKKIAQLERNLEQLVNYLQKMRDESDNKPDAFDPLKERPPHY